MKRVEPEQIGKLIEKIMMEGANGKVALEQRASYLWPEIVGPGVNRFTSRRYVADGILHVFITSASLKNELSFCRQQLVDAINNALGRTVLSAVEIH